MAPIHVRILEVFPSHEPGGARLRRALIFCRWERSGLDGVSPHPFKVPMRDLGIVPLKKTCRRQAGGSKLRPRVPAAQSESEIQIDW